MGKQRDLTMIENMSKVRTPQCLFKGAALPSFSCQVDVESFVLGIRMDRYFVSRSGQCNTDYLLILA